MHQVQKKSNPDQMRSTTVKDARELGLLPSVTSIIKILDRPALSSWKQEQAVMAALTLHKKDDETLDDFAKRVVIDAESIAVNAATKGVKIHNAIERFLVTGEVCTDPEVALLIQPFYAWAKENILKVHKCEDVLISADGYAGRLDLKADFKDIGTAYADFKSRKPSNGKINTYPEDGYQLAAYRRADDDRAARCVSILINSEKPDTPFIHAWDETELNECEDVFLHCFHIWKIQKQYRPQVKR